MGISFEKPKTGAKPRCTWKQRSRRDRVDIKLQTVSTFSARSPAPRTRGHRDRPFLFNTLFSMKLLMHLAEVLVGDVSVHLRGTNMCVSK